MARCVSPALKNPRVQIGGREKRGSEDINRRRSGNLLGRERHRTGGGRGQLDNLASIALILTGGREEKKLRTKIREKRRADAKMLRLGSGGEEWVGKNGHRSQSPCV